MYTMSNFFLWFKRYFIWKFKFALTFFSFPHCITVYILVHYKIKFKFLKLRSFLWKKSPIKSKIGLETNPIQNISVNITFLLWQIYFFRLLPIGDPLKIQTVFESYTNKMVNGQTEAWTNKTSSALSLRKTTRPNIFPLAILIQILKTFFKTKGYLNQLENPKFRKHLRNKN